MTFAQRLAQLEARRQTCHQGAEGHAVEDLVAKLERHAARLVEGGGIADPGKASFADLLALCLFGDGTATDPDVAELVVRCRERVANEPEDGTALEHLAGAVLEWLRDCGAIAE